jgi:butyryl-CoA dehydrogenase
MFELSEELTMVRDAAREFAERELKPRATKHDRQEHLDPEVLKLIGELGFWGLTVSEEYGGSGMGNLALSIVLEELNRGCGATGVTVSVHNSLLCSPLMKFGNADQKQRFLP